MAARVEDWRQRQDREACAALGEVPGCLSVPLGHTRTRLVGEELEIRRFETNLGDWVADQALAAYADRGAQVAFLNSGSLRLNQDVPAGGAVTRRAIEELFPYPGSLRLLRLRGSTLQQVVTRAVQDWTGNGWWLQIAGFAFRHDPDTDSATDLTLLTPAGPRPIDPDEEILAVTGDFLVDPASGQDGYTMLGPDQVVALPGDRPEIKSRVAAALAAAGAAGIAPRVEGRICNRRRPGPCLALGAWVAGPAAAPPAPALQAPDCIAPGGA